MRHLETVFALNLKMYSLRFFSLFCLKCEKFFLYSLLHVKDIILKKSKLFFFKWKMEESISGN